MIKKNKLKIIISSLIVLLPILFGVIMWNDLPEYMATHFGTDGNADGFGVKAFSVFGIPAIMLILHLVCLFFTLLDKKQKEQSTKALGMVFWILPMLSLFVNAVIYSVAMGKEVSLSTFVPALIGVLFMVMGNYMPKIKQNSTLGIKTPWALRNEENWNKTHRFGGKLMVFGGFVIVISAFLPLEYFVTVLLCVVIAVAIAPMLYSYLIYKKHQKEGIAYFAPIKSTKSRIISAIIISLITIGIVVVMLVGDIDVKCREEALEISATFWSDLTVKYSEIDTVEYRKDLDIGIRTNGFSSARLSLGLYQNDEFGSYILYAYTGAEEFVVISSDGDILVIGMKDNKDIRAIYDTVSSKIGG